MVCEPKKEYQFGETHVLLNNQCLIEFEKGWCDIYHDGNQQEFITAVTALISLLKKDRDGNRWK